MDATGAKGYKVAIAFVILAALLLLIYLIFFPDADSKSDLGSISEENSSHSDQAQYETPPEENNHNASAPNAGINPDPTSRQSPNEADPNGETDEDETPSEELSVLVVKVAYVEEYDPPVDGKRKEALPVVGAVISLWGSSIKARELSTDSEGKMVLTLVGIEKDTYADMYIQATGFESFPAKSRIVKGEKVFERYLIKKKIDEGYSIKGYLIDTSDSSSAAGLRIRLISGYVVQHLQNRLREELIEKELSKGSIERRVFEDQIWETRTDIKGRFAFMNINPHRRSSYAPVMTVFDAEDNILASFKVKYSKKDEYQEYRLDLSTKYYEWRVVDVLGVPVDGAAVDVLFVGGLKGTRFMNQGGFTLKTDSNGLFAFTLGAGIDQFFARISKDGYVGNYATPNTKDYHIVLERDSLAVFRLVNAETGEKVFEPDGVRLFVKKTRMVEEVLPPPDPTGDIGPGNESKIVEVAENYWSRLTEGIEPDLENESYRLSGLSVGFYDFRLIVPGFRIKTVSFPTAETDNNSPIEIGLAPTNKVKVYLYDGSLDKPSSTRKFRLFWKTAGIVILEERFWYREGKPLEIDLLTDEFEFDFGSYDFRVNRIGDRIDVTYYPN